ncbi:peptidoglycan DD-metalloendopeptidase family protein [Acetobacteraceae bacterium KSS8]|uniref:Peptidoglycan DD-metalloendopeptidase family protein n=1 Tax=Endosaccharibacter trunci TaxID=2812733 RepID=A0ABT1W2F0_9PROT|nr:peptidoglycan DD-metalloendopeptidase family protein [Acetobacteraceae bacterium KSS8]
MKAASAQSEAARAEAARAAAERDAARAAAQAATEHALALSRQTVQAAAAVQRTEAAADAAQSRTETLEREKQAAAAELDAESRSLAPLLPVIERLSLYPSETLLAAPFAPADSLTALSVLRHMGADLEKRAEATRAAAAKLQAAGAALDAERARLDALQRDQAAQQAALQSRADAARKAQAASTRQLQDATRAAAAAAARSSTLDGVVARLEAAQKAAEAAAQRAARIAASHARSGKGGDTRQAAEDAARLALPAGPGLSAGQAGAPVAGQIVQRFGAQTDAGPASGVRYAPPSLATVTAPCAGRIDFAGAFRSYGQMLILDCGKGDRFVLAGLGAIDVGIGQSVARGAQLGHMPGWNGSGARPNLFLQLRHGDRTVDPMRVLSR